jgi:signal transduction histidine kinase
MDRTQRHARLSWFFVAAMLLLCATLGVLQYRWIDEASRAERERLRGSLQASLFRLSVGFNSDLVNACAAILPRGVPPGAEVPDTEFAALYKQWRESGQHGRLFSAIAIARPEKGSLALHSLNLDTAVFSPSPWPAAWQPMRQYLESRLSQMRDNPEMRGGGRFLRPAEIDEGFLIELPRRGRFEPGQRADPEWLIFEVNSSYLHDTLLPELLSRHLGASSSDYQVEIVSRHDPARVIYRFPEAAAQPIGLNADASVPLFDVAWDQIFRRNGPPGFREFMRARPAPGPAGRWQLSIRHRSGSVDAVVARTRLRNLGVTAAILLLMLATVAALIHFTRRAQRLATLQMNFVAGVSHELRTPLTVIRTAAFNLRGKLAQNPAQVEKYGALIRQEAERLTAIVEDVLQFASHQAGRSRLNLESVPAETVIDAGIAACRAVLDSSHCVVEKDIQPGLPPILGDSVALQHAIQNLLTNAAKYGASPGAAPHPNWIGVAACSPEPGWIEIRVSDHGPGISSEELPSIFDPFYRGQRAIQDQVHGTGLGLALVQGILQAHNGSVSAASDPGRLTTFTLRLPAAPPAPLPEASAASLSPGATP